jgi:hypothetical protein
MPPRSQVISTIEAMTEWAFLIYWRINERLFFFFISKQAS